jgi:F-type H+-transporting ATPase subunit epsilon
MATNKIELHIVTPEREFYTAEVDMLTFKTTEGFMGVLYDHIPVITTLTSGKATFVNGKEEFEAVLHNGFAEIGEEKITILTDAAEWADEIDIERALSARERAENRLAELSHSEEVIVQAEASLIRALARIEMAQARQAVK